MQRRFVISSDGYAKVWRTLIQVVGTLNSRKIKRCPKKTAQIVDVRAEQIVRDNKRCHIVDVVWENNRSAFAKVYGSRCSRFQVYELTDHAKLLRQLCKYQVRGTVQ